MIVFDAHAHGDREECALRQKQGVLTMLSSGTPEQAEKAFALAEEFPVLCVTSGLHPWYSNQYDVEAMLPYVKKVPVIGEIGLDCVWCEVPMEIQKKVFIRQLDWVREMGKPVVLHTKGCESAIADILDDYPELTCIVHWYSGPVDVLPRYLSRKNCYFTIGPDAAVSESVQAVIQAVPQDRILFETDGMGAVRWAIGEVKTECLSDVLQKDVVFAAKMRGVSPEALAQAANENFLRLSRMQSR